MCGVEPFYDFSIASSHCTVRIVAGPRIPSSRFELVIRHYLPDPNMGVPYWDSTLDAELPEPTDSMMFTDIFLGETNDEGLVVTGPYANWTSMEVFIQFHLKGSE